MLNPRQDKIEDNSAGIVRDLFIAKELMNRGGEIGGGLGETQRYAHQANTI